MPGRLTIILILAFLAGMISLQWARQIAQSQNEAPQLKPSLELAAEDGATKWVLYANGKRLGDALSSVNKTQSGVYTVKQQVELNGDLEAYLGKSVSGLAKMVNIRLHELTVSFGTNMDLTYLGTLRSLQLSFAARPKLLGSQRADGAVIRPPPGEQEQRDEKSNLFRLHLKGVVENDHLTFKGSVSLAGYRVPIDDYKVKYRNKDSFFSTLAPNDCLAGLRLGQRWQTAVLDPTEMLTNALAQSKTKELTTGMIDPDEFVKKRITEVRVLDELKVLEWNHLKIPCYLVQSQDRGTRIQIWVHASTYRVLKQVAEWPGNSIELIRVPKSDD